MTQPKLYAVYLGGRAPKANTELHDVVFATGARIEETYTQLLDKWFGDPKSLHLDSWLELDVVDGWRVSLHRPASPSCEAQEGEVAVAGPRDGESRRGAMKLYFVNLGAYDESFTELHAMGFYVAATPEAAKKRALAQHFTRGVTLAHKDDLHDVDDCIAVDAVSGLHVRLTKTGETSETRPQNSYHPIPKDVIAAWLAR